MEPSTEKQGRSFWVNRDYLREEKRASIVVEVVELHNVENIVILVVLSQNIHHDWVSFLVEVYAHFFQAWE